MEWSPPPQRSQVIDGLRITSWIPWRELGLLALSRALAISATSEAERKPKRREPVPRLSLLSLGVSMIGGRGSRVGGPAAPSMTCHLSVGTE